MAQDRHYHASALAAGMPLASRICRRPEAACSFLLTLFARLPPADQARLRRRLESYRFALLPPYVLLIEECCAPCRLP